MFDASLPSAGLVFCPLVVNTFIGWHTNAFSIITRSSQQLVCNVDWETGEQVHHFCQWLAICLIKDCVQILDIRIPSFAPASMWMMTW